jgi:WD40 repeat protein
LHLAHPRAPFFGRGGSIFFSGFRTGSCQSQFSCRIGTYCCSAYTGTETSYGLSFASTSGLVMGSPDGVKVFDVSSGAPLWKSTLCAGSSAMLVVPIEGGLARVVACDQTDRETVRYMVHAFHLSGSQPLTEAPGLPPWSTCLTHPGSVGMVPLSQKPGLSRRTRGEKATRALAITGQGTLSVWYSSPPIRPYSGQTCTAVQPVNQEEGILRFGHHVVCLASSIAGSLVAAGYHDGLIKIFYIYNQYLRFEIRSLLHTGHVSCLAFSLGNKILASASIDNTIRIWDVRTWRELSTLSGHTGYVSCLAFNASGTLLASGSTDKTIKVCDMSRATPTLHDTLAGHRFWVLDVCFNPVASILASVNSRGTLFM